MVRAGARRGLDGSEVVGAKCEPGSETHSSMPRRISASTPGWGKANGNTLVRSSSACVPASVDSKPKTPRCLIV
jgi:hypothetical protein